MTARVLVAVMGPYPRPVSEGSSRTNLDTVREARDASIAAGVAVDVAIIPDMVRPEEKVGPFTNRARGFAQMRAVAAKAVLDNGYSHLFCVDNDVLLKPDTITRLVGRQVALVIPRPLFPQFPPASVMDFAPQPANGTKGLWELRWSEVSVLLFSRGALEILEGRVYPDGAVKEDELFVYWQAHGIKAVMDLDAEVEIIELPSGEAISKELPWAVHNRNPLLLGPGGQPVQCRGPVTERVRTGQTVVWTCEGCRFFAFWEAPKFRDLTGQAKSA